VFYLEYDRGTEAFGALSRKLVGYLRLAAGWTEEQELLGSRPRSRCTWRARISSSGLDVRIVSEDGELLRELVLDPSRDYQPMG
jgi:hypothetical protein